MTINVGVYGAGGRMGSTVCRTIEAEQGLALVAALDPHHVGLDLRAVAGTTTDLAISSHPQALLDAGVQVAIDFTEAHAARENLDFMAEHGIHAVVGTTGLSDADIADLEKKFTKSNCVIAPNFAIGAILMMKFAAVAAPYFETAEILEFHHDQKVDSPSGTALLTAERMGAAKSDWAPDPTEHHVVAGARGGGAPGGVTNHEIRVGGVVGLGGTGARRPALRGVYSVSLIEPNDRWICPKTGTPKTYRSSNATTTSSPMRT